MDIIITAVSFWNCINRILWCMEVYLPSILGAIVEHDATVP